MASESRPGQTRKQEVVDALCEAFARDEMGLEEFERRVEAAHRAGSAAELDRLLSDLPSAKLPTRSGRAAAAPGPRALGRRALPPPGGVRDSEVVVGIMGGSSRTGRWVPARRTTAIGVMGGVELDYRDALLPPGVTEVRAFAFWGGVSILAPPDVRVECTGMGIMGGFDHREDAAVGYDASAPVLRITGLAMMGGVDVRVRYPGESAKDARRRLRHEREARRLRGGAPPRDDE